MVWLKKLCCLFENLILGNLLKFLTDLPMDAYKMVAYKKSVYAKMGEIRRIYEISHQI